MWRDTNFVSGRPQVKAMYTQQASCLNYDDNIKIAIFTADGLMRFSRRHREKQLNCSEASRLLDDLLLNSKKTQTGSPDLANFLNQQAKFCASSQLSAQH